MHEPFNVNDAVGLVRDAERTVADARCQVLTRRGPRAQALNRLRTATLGLELAKSVYMRALEREVLGTGARPRG